MPKNAPCNSFYMFMRETKRRLEARGERFAGGMEEVVGIAADQWERMTPEQKNSYKDKAKEYKKSDQYSTYKKEVKGRVPIAMRSDASSRRRQRTSKVVEEEFVAPMPYLYLSDDEDAVAEFKKKHQSDREEIMVEWRWNMPERGAIYNLKFFVVSFIGHGRSGVSFFPGEVGIVEFSLRDGVTNTYTKIIGPHSLPQSLVRAATEQMEIHKIPFADSVTGMTDDYNRVLDEVLRFCRPSKNLRRLFCISKEFNAVQGCISFLQNKTKQAEFKMDRINCIEDLYFLLCEWRDKSCAPAELRAFNDCDGMTDMAPFYRHPDLLCEYHSSIGVHRCALATAKRSTYFLLRRIQSYYGLPKTDRHCLRELTDEEKVQVPPMDPLQQLAMATRQCSLYDPRNTFEQRDDGAVAATGVSRRRLTSVNEDDDIGMPQTLPRQVRELTGALDVPDAWKNKDRSSVNGEPDKSYRPTSRARAAPLMSRREAVQEATRPVNIVWNQNRDLRNQVYAENHALKAQQKAGGGTNVGVTKRYP